MPVDIEALVAIHIRPVLAIDVTLLEDIPYLVSSQNALQGWDEATMDDKQRVYVAALTLESLVPRLAFIYADEVQSQREGPQTVWMPSRTEFFKVLQKAIDNLKATSGYGAGVVTADDEVILSNPWPGVGLAKWGVDA